jgi:coenzyme F420-0:L-glutamate ligase/coenzyme F420-1:gamma-L-glutamate ligase
VAKSAGSSVILTPVKLPLVRLHADLCSTVLYAMENRGVTPRKGDVLAVASKVVSFCEGRILPLNKSVVSGRARRLAQAWHMDARLTEIVVREADEILGGVNGFLLTVKNGILTANAGVDLKNAPAGTVALWPAKPDRTARQLRRCVEKRFRTRVGVVIVDSRVTPMRLGTVGLALGASGLVPVIDERGESDLFGRRVKFTQTNVADDIASSAHLLMGETKERVGAVLVRNAKIHLRSSSDCKMARLGRSSCLIASSLR